MNSISCWLCTNISKNHGHVELHDRPILAAELVNRNPRCCDAHPTLFEELYAIVSPETTLVLGQKYYVVPLSTIRKLQLKHPTSKTQHNDHYENIGNTNDGGDTDRSSVCWLFRNNKNGAKEKNGNKNMGLRIKIIAQNSESSSDDMKTERNKKRRAHEEFGGEIENGGSSSPGRLTLASMDNWQTGFESITED